MPCSARIRRSPKNDWEAAAGGSWPKSFLGNILWIASFRPIMPFESRRFWGGLEPHMWAEPRPTPSCLGRGCMFRKNYAFECGQKTLEQTLIIHVPALYLHQCQSKFIQLAPSNATCHNSGWRRGWAIATGRTQRRGWAIAMMKNWGLVKCSAEGEQ